MGKKFNIEFESNDIGQVLDGLQVRAEAWRRTEDYLQGNGNSEEIFLIEECDDVDEAGKIAALYERLIANIEEQIEAQGGW